MRVRLLSKPKPNNYTESCMINEADRWRGRNVWYPGRSVRYALKMLNTQKSAEVIVAERRRTESVGVLSMTEKGGMTVYGRKH